MTSGQKEFGGLKETLSQLSFEMGWVVRFVMTMPVGALTSRVSVAGVESQLWLMLHASCPGRPREAA